jgi:hypothetical protein
MKKFISLLFLTVVLLSTLSAQQEHRNVNYCSKFKVSHGILVKRIITVQTDSTYSTISETTPTNLYIFKDGDSWVLYNCGNCTQLATNTSQIVFDDRLRTIIELEGGSIVIDYVWN